MNIEVLKYFQYVARYKNLTQAARHLYVSQPTLSRYIMSLETELGVKLFKRDNKIMNLTAAGTVLYNPLILMLLFLSIQLHIREMT